MAWRSLWWRRRRREIVCNGYMRVHFLLIPLAFSRLHFVTVHFAPKPEHSKYTFDSSCRFIRVKLSAFDRRLRLGKRLRRRGRGMVRTRSEIWPSRVARESRVKSFRCWGLVKRLQPSLVERVSFWIQ